MYHTTGFTKDEIIDLCVMVQSADLEQDLNHLASGSWIVQVGRRGIDLLAQEPSAG